VYHGSSSLVDAWLWFGFARATQLRCNADQWDAQATIVRVNESLIDRGYVTWFDLTNMKGE
jgi:hypothetical protein